jgi:type IV fimbrial biogenesis protein FimT
MNNKGFTLAEVLVTIGILGIMAAISIPSYISWLPRHRLQTSARQIYDDLNLAKMEAVRRNTNICITFSTANNNYRVFVDPDSNGVYASPPDTILKDNVALENSVKISNTTTIAFNNRGMAASIGNVNVTNPTGTMRISVITTGNISISTL